MSLHGAADLRARLRAIKDSFKPVGRAWATETVRQLRMTAPRRTGKGARSMRIRNANTRKATVSAIYYMSILDKGYREHTVAPRRRGVLRFQAGGRTVFARKALVRARPGMLFARRAAGEALRRNPLANALIAEWNKAR